MFILICTFKPSDSPAPNLNLNYREKINTLKKKLRREKVTKFLGKWRSFSWTKNLFAKIFPDQFQGGGNIFRQVTKFLPDEKYNLMIRFLMGLEFGIFSTEVFTCADLTGAKNSGATQVIWNLRVFASAKAK